MGIRELKAKLSEYIRLIKAGEEVLVTDRGEIVAELVPPRVFGRSGTSGLERLASEGIVLLGGQNRPEAYPDLEPIVEPGESADMLDQERGGW